MGVSVSWTTDDGRHELYLAAAFTDGSLGSGSNAAGVRVMDSPDGSPLPADEWHTRPDKEVTGWVVCCTHHDDGGYRSATERLATWDRVATSEEEQPEVGRFYESDSAIDLDTRADVEELMLKLWHSHLEPVNARTAISGAAEEVARATRALDQAVQTGRTAGLTWAEIGQAAGIARQSAHERWGGR